MYNQNMSSILQYIFYLPAVLFLISGIPQTVKLIKTKSSKDISITMYIMTFVAVSIVVLDAYLKGNTSIMVSNLASLSITGLNTFLVYKYRKN